MVEVLDLLKITLLMMLFYSASITILVYVMPDNAKHYITSFSDIASTYDLEATNAKLQSNLQSQTRLPLIDIGALIFYSGNLLVDLILNFIFALPQMIVLLLTGIARIFNFPTDIFNIVQIFLSVYMTAFYIVSLLQMLTNARSGRVV